MHPCHINDQEFANALVDSFLEISLRNPVSSTSHQIKVHEPSQGIHNMESLSCSTICYSPSNFPDARPGKCCKNRSSN